MSNEYVFSFQSDIIALQLPDHVEETLPKNVVLKIEYPKRRHLFDPVKTGLFNNEALIYNRLRPLQGSIIPRYLGFASITGRRAHLFDRL
ncbi:hypothetical protein BDP81DRAFT_391575 [Colletotrichum phormii]|uniref:Uncharacterized protein n=1 Tax=Colletotrichum phormii TaxID=359342 RepID=A0AAJ0EHY1_9PEZI|nr:uncharacterized protein BDP81DRAFT_391575 [Colletotrichum phormii]KAK1639474.1 hypothetical protein BDP81DRAFT_391575 [Colletotrichum phormii]